MTTFTVFCRQADNAGATWIDTVDAPDGSVYSARELAEVKCAEDCGYDPAGVVCIGVATPMPDDYKPEAHYW